jgi:hypothetical protein
MYEKRFEVTSNLAFGGKGKSIVVGQPVTSKKKVDSSGHRIEGTVVDMKFNLNSVATSYRVKWGDATLTWVKSRDLV